MTLKLHTDLSSRGHDTIFTGDGKLRNKEKDQNDKCRLYPAGGGGYSVANYRSDLSHFWANVIIAIPTKSLSI